MRIGIDCRTILNSKSSERAGVAHYSYYLLKHILEIDKKILAVVLISIVGGFLGSFLYINYGQSLILTSGGNQNKDNTVSYFQDDNNKLIKVTEDSATIDIVKEASVSVVSVNITKDISNQGPLGGQSPFEEFFFWFVMSAIGILSFYEFFDDDRK